MRKADAKEFFKNNEKIAIIHSVWNKNLQKHFHDWFEIFFITNGEGIHILNNTPTLVKTGDLFLIMPNNEHNLIAKTTPFEWTNVLFFPSVILDSLNNLVSTENLLKILINPSNKLDCNFSSLTNIEILERQQNLYNIIEEMEMEYSKREPSFEKVLKNDLEILLIKIFRTCFPSSKSHKDIPQFIIDYLKQKNLADVDIDEIAAKSFYCPSYFRKLFKKKTGISLCDFIRKKRLEYAMQLLKTTNLTIEAIMTESGFNDKKSFYIYFKKAYNNTPGQYRKNIFNQVK